MTTEAPAGYQLLDVFTGNADGKLVGGRVAWKGDVVPDDLPRVLVNRLRSMRRVEEIHAADWTPPSEAELARRSNLLATQARLREEKAARIAQEAEVDRAEQLASELRHYRSLPLALLERKVRTLQHEIELAEFARAERLQEHANAAALVTGDETGAEAAG